MSENTNTPNGASKDLYTSNQDIIETNFLALEERDPQKENNNSNIAGTNSVIVPGTNSVIVPVEIGTINTKTMEKVGYVGIPVNVRDKEVYEKDKAQIKRRAEESQKSHDKNNDSIDDRMQ